MRAPYLSIVSVPEVSLTFESGTLWRRQNFCDSSSLDPGAHTLAAVVSGSFLRFSASRGNDLRTLLGPDCKWCLCVERWKEALQAHARGQIADDAVPRVLLQSTHRRALDTVVRLRETLQADSLD